MITKPRLLKLNEETVMVELNTKEKRDTKKGFWNGAKQTIERMFQSPK